MGRNKCDELTGTRRCLRRKKNRDRGRPDTGKASSSGQPMEVDDERKSAVPEQVTVDATKVTEEKEEEGKPSWADVEGDETM